MGILLGVSSESTMSEATSRRCVVSYGTGQPNDEERSDELKGANEASTAKSSS